MADEQVTISVVLKDAFSAAGKKLRTVFNDILKTLEKSGRAGKAASVALRGVGNAAKTLASVLRNPAQALRNLLDRLEKSGGAGRAFARTMRGIGGSLRAAGSRMLQFGKTVGGVLTKVRRSFLNVRTAFAAGVGGFGLVKAVEASAQIEKNMAEVLTLLGDITDEQGEQLKRNLIEAARKGGQAIEDEIGAAYQAISSGVEQKELLEFLKTANKLAAGGVTDVKSSVDLLTTVLNAYGKEAGDAAEVSDILFKTVEKGRTTIPELSRFLFQVAPAAASAGVEIEQVTAAIAALTASGVPTRVATTQLRQVIVELADDTSDAGEAFRKVSGKAFPEFIRAGGTMVGAMKLLQQRAEQTGQSVGQIFSSIEAGLGAEVLAGEGFDKFGESLDAISNSSGAAEKAFNRLRKTLSFAFQQLKTGLAGLIDTVIDVVIPRLTQVAKRVSDVAAGFGRVLRLAREQKVDDAALSKVLESAFKLVLDFATDVGTTIGIVIIETLNTGLKILEPTLSDIFRDALGPLLSEIPGVDIAPSAGAQLKKTQEGIEVAKQAVKELDDAIKEAREEQSKFDKESDLKGFNAAVARTNQLYVDRGKLLVGIHQSEVRVANEVKKNADEQKRRIELVGASVKNFGGVWLAQLSIVKKRFDENLANLQENINEIAPKPEIIEEKTKPAAKSLEDTLTSALDNVKKFGIDVFDKIRKEIARTQAFAEENADLFQSLRARELAATGRTDEAAQLALETKQLKERIELQGKFRAEFKLIEPTLLRVQKVERERFAAQREVTKLVKEATTQQRDFQKALQQVANEEKLGIRITEERKAAIERQRAALVKSLKETKATLESIGEDSRFADLVIEQIKRIEFALDDLAVSAGKSARTISEGIEAGFKEFQDRAAINFENIKALTIDVAMSISDNLTNSLGDFIDGTKSAKEAFKAFAADTLKEIARLILRQAVLNAVSSAGGFFGLGANEGGLIGFEEGGPVPGPRVHRDVVHAKLTPGEFVEPEESVNYYGAPFMEAIRRRLIPKMAFSGMPRASVTRVPKTAFQTGGPVESTAASTAPQVATVIANDENLERMLAGGRNAFYRFLSDNSAQIRGELKVGTAQ